MFQDQLRFVNAEENAAILEEKLSQYKHSQPAVTSVLVESGTVLTGMLALFLAKSVSALNGAFSLCFFFSFF